MLQHILVRRIERIYRLRLLYGLHLTVFGMAALVVALAGAAYWHDGLLALILWLPTLVAHTAAQSLVELRQRCVVYEPAPVQAFNYQALPVDVYDEHGNVVGVAGSERSTHGERDFLLPG